MLLDPTSLAMVGALGAGVAMMLWMVVESAGPKSSLPTTFSTLGRLKHSHHQSIDNSPYVHSLLAGASDNLSSQTLTDLAQAKALLAQFALAVSEASDAGKAGATPPTPPTPLIAPPNMGAGSIGKSPPSSNKAPATPGNKAKMGTITLDQFKAMSATGGLPAMTTPIKPVEVDMDDDDDLDWGDDSDDDGDAGAGGIGGGNGNDMMDSKLRRFSEDHSWDAADDAEDASAGFVNDSDNLGKLKALSASSSASSGQMPYATSRLRAALHGTSANSSTLSSPSSSRGPSSPSRNADGPLSPLARFNMVPELRITFDQHARKGPAWKTLPRNFGSPLHVTSKGETPIRRKLDTLWDSPASSKASSRASSKPTTPTSSSPSSSALLDALRGSPSTAAGRPLSLPAGGFVSQEAMSAMVSEGRVGNMVFDRSSGKWVAVGGEDEDDPFAGVEGFDEDEDDAQATHGLSSENIALTEKTEFNLSEEDRKSMTAAATEHTTSLGHWISASPSPSVVNAVPDLRSFDTT